jgi:hypothetical protein
MNNLFKGLPNFFSKQGFAIVVGLLGTGIGAYGGMPAPPKTFIKLVDRFPILQWALVYVLIWQGAGGFDEKLSLYGTLIVFGLYKLIKHAEKHWELLYYLGLSEQKRSVLKAAKKAKKAKEAKEAKEEEDKDLETSSNSKSFSEKDLLDADEGHGRFGFFG